MGTQRSIVDYSMRRRAMLSDLRAGRTSRPDACDAHPHLLSAARYHGESTDRPCPLCDGPLTEVHFIYGDELGRAAGQAHRLRELPLLAMSYPRFTVYVVEVCAACRWNHMTLSYVLGRDGLATEPEPEGSGRTGGPVRRSSTAGRR